MNAITSRIAVPFPGLCSKMAGGTAGSKRALPFCGTRSCWHGLWATNDGREIMPKAESKKQQMAESMSEKELHDMAATKRKDLPTRESKG